MKVIILAGGKATRLPESAKDIPKVLVDVGGKSMLQHQIEQLGKHGFFDIRLALGYRAEQIIEWLRQYQLATNNCLPAEAPAKEGQLSIDYVVEPEPLDTGGAIKFAAQGFHEPFLVFNGDILSDINLKNFHKRFQEIRAQNLIAVTYMPDARSYGIIKKRGRRVVEFLEKPILPVPGHINAGFYILSPQIFENIKEKKFSIEKNIFPQLALQGNLGYYVHRGFWTDAGTEERLREVRKLLIGSHGRN